MSDKIDKVESITMTLSEIGAVLSLDNGYPQWKIGNRIINKFEEFVIQIWSWRQKNKNKQISKQEIGDILFYMECERRHGIFSQFLKTIEYDPSCVDRFEDLTRYMTQKNYEPMYPIILRHIIWTIKRRMNSKSVYCPIFLSIYGPAGSGKSEFLNEFFSIVPECLKSSVENVSSLFSDEREHFRFIDNYVLIMDELSRMKNTDCNHIKNQIDLKMISYRALGFNKLVKGMNNSQLIGTSNTRLRNTITVDVDIRKWCEMDIHKFSDHEVKSKNEYLRQFDWLSLWKSVNENGDSPFHDVETYSTFRAWTSNKCEHESEHVEYIRKIMTDRAGEFISKKLLYDDGYRKVVTEYPLTWPNFKEKCEKFGFVSKRTKSDRGLIVPGPITTTDEP